MPQNPDELGALWMKSGAKGDYMTGTISGVKVVVFRNTFKEEGSNKPDWRVLKSKPKEEREDDAPQHQPVTTSITDSDIPF